MKPFLKVENFSLRFDGHTRNTLTDVSFELEQGECVLLLGASGSGKSTLTFSLNGLYPRELDGEVQGDIFIDGKKTTAYRPGELSQSVGVVFQDPETQFCMLTVEDEVAFGLENIRVPYEQMEAKINNSLALVGLQQYKNVPIHTLSGGQKQKLALACVLALEPQILILDEPTANLDPVATADLIDTIQALSQKINCSLMIIEHQLDGWTRLAERCLLLNRSGQIFFDGSLRWAIANHLSSLDAEGIWLPKVTQTLVQYGDVCEDVALPLTLAEFQQRPETWPTAADLSRQVGNQYGVNSLKQPKALLEADKIHLTLQDRHILQNVKVTLHAGEFVAIVGANGSGKTTLLRILAGLQKPTSGAVRVQGKKIEQWREVALRQMIGYVFQNPEHQFITNSVYDEVAFSMRLRGAEEAEVDQTVRRILELCQLSQLEHEHPFRLSQGQKRRLSVATMIVDHQQLLLLDEPTFGQDAHSNANLMNLLQERFDAGTAIVMITHDMELVHEYATRIIVMAAGAVVFDHSPQELWKLPENILREWQITVPLPIQMERVIERNVVSNVSSST